MARTETKKLEKEILSSEPVYTIGIAVKKLDVSVHSLRQYEKEGLIIPFRTLTGRRLYSDLELEKVRCIKEMIQVEGLNFEGIRRIMAFIPCYKIRGCSKKVKNSCRAFTDKTLPCWASEEKCDCQLPSCRDCPVYQRFVHCDDIKPLIYEAEK
ncbi:MAG: MerR family transcriptional regulator [Desulfobacterales bacterium]|nr:MerR family transcriptional regulator [Desulfobacterales bacterium]